MWQEKLIQNLIEAKLSGTTRALLKARRGNRKGVPNIVRATELVKHVPQSVRRRNQRARDFTSNEKRVAETPDHRKVLAKHLRDLRKDSTVNEGSLSLRRALRAIKVKEKQNTQDKAERGKQADKARAKKKFRQQKTEEQG